jgi:hypothetical protein
MTSTPSRRKRPYLASGLYRHQPPSPEVEQAMAELRAQMIADKGGPENVSTAERILIDLAVAAAMKHEAVARYLLTLPSLVDKRHRKVWTVVRDCTALASHLQSLLRDLGLERRAKDANVAVRIAAMHETSSGNPRLQARQE